jgi:hypothetical protein
VNDGALIECADFSALWKAGLLAAFPNLCRPLKRGLVIFGGWFPGLRSLLAHPGLNSAATSRLVDADTLVARSFRLYPDLIALIESLTRRYRGSDSGAICLRRPLQKSIERSKVIGQEFNPYEGSNN